MRHIVNIFGSTESAVEAFRKLGGASKNFSGAQLLSRVIGQSSMGFTLYRAKSVSVSDLGFEEPASYQEIFKKGVSLGLAEFALESAITYAILSGRRDRTRIRCATFPIEIGFSEIVIPVLYIEPDGSMYLEGEPIDEEPWLLDRTFTFVELIAR